MTQINLLKNKMTLPCSLASGKSKLFEMKNPFSSKAASMQFICGCKMFKLFAAHLFNSEKLVALALTVVNSWLHFSCNKFKVSYIGEQHIKTF